MIFYEVTILIWVILVESDKVYTQYEEVVFQWFRCFISESIIVKLFYHVFFSSPFTISVVKMASVDISIILTLDLTTLKSNIILIIISLFSY